MILQNILTGFKCLILRVKLKRGIRKRGGRISGNVKLTVGEEATFKFGKALYLNGGGITAAQRMQIVVNGGLNYA